MGHPQIFFYETTIMPRRPRIKLAGIPQHIVQRGINREACFFAEEDYHCYLHWLMKSAADWRCTIHAYVLMTSHVHLLVTPETADGSARLMQSTGRRYVQYINRSYKRSGSLWEGNQRGQGRVFLSDQIDAVAPGERGLPGKDCAKQTATEIAPLKE